MHARNKTDAFQITSYDSLHLLIVVKKLLYVVIFLNYAKLVANPTVCSSTDNSQLDPHEECVSEKQDLISTNLNQMLCIGRESLLIVCEDTM